MKRFLNKILFNLYLTFQSILTRISISLYNAEIEILKADPNDLQEGDKKITRNLHRNQTLEKFYAGQKDEQYANNYYEVLKKAETFKKTSTPHKVAVAADKHLRFIDFDSKEQNIDYKLEDKDQYGKRYSHFGFYDEKHKHSGKTIAEVLVSEMEERRTKDDDYELLEIYNNTPIEVGFAKVLDVVEKTKKENVDFEYEVLDVFRKSKQFEFPIKVIRKDENTINKIEQLSEFLHIKKIGFEYRQLEFFVPLKFKTIDLENDSEIFKEIINIENVYLSDNYGNLNGFGIIEFTKRIKYNDTHEVLKFKAFEMENVKS